MKITVINGTEKHGVTYRIKEIFLQNFQGADVVEFYLPKDCPSFCIGCTSCFMKGENNCKDFDYTHKIEKSLIESDLIVMTSPAYVMHATGAMKSLLDHLGYRWMPHRPAPEMFGKRAVIITQCLGAGAKLTAKDIKHSLSWWGISKIGMFSGSLMSDIIWDKLSEKKRKKLTKKINKLAVRFSKINYAKPAHTTLITKIKFKFCRMIQKKVRKNGVVGLDNEYWCNNGWLGKSRPWKI
ncbi:MAG: flavodoxin family protein [Clostridia bacterium]|jgi:multimeric flavodoxin WrbA|nr:flavodoxin family protein [Clostridia bacterium]